MPLPSCSCRERAQAGGGVPKLVGRVGREGPKPSAGLQEGSHLPGGGCG